MDIDKIKKAAASICNEIETSKKAGLIVENNEFWRSIFAGIIVRNLTEISLQDLDKIIKTCASTSKPNK